MTPHLTLDTATAPLHPSTRIPTSAPTLLLRRLAGRTVPALAALLIAGAPTGRLQAEGVAPVETDKGYALYGEAKAVFDEDRVVLRAEGVEAAQPTVIVRKIVPENGVVTLTARATHLGSIHRSIYLALGSSESPGAFVLGGPMLGLKRNAILQYTRLDAEASDFFLPPAGGPLPALEFGFRMGLMIDPEREEIHLAVEGCAPIRRPLKTPLGKVDLAGFGLRGNTAARFENVETIFGRDEGLEALRKIAENVRESVTLRTVPVSGASSPEETGWVDNLNKAPPSILSLQESQEGRILVAGVSSRAEIFLREPIRMSPGRVYRLSFTGRVVGQVEQVIANFGTRRFPQIQLPLHRDWHRYSVQFRAGGAQHHFALRFLGVGEFHIKDYELVETHAFELPDHIDGDNTPFLLNGDFALGEAGWQAWYPQRTAFATTSGRPTERELIRMDAGTGRHALVNPGDGRVLAAYTTPLIFDYGKTYRLEVEGQAPDGEVFAALIRPGMSALDNVVLPLNFVDGVAVADYEAALPETGMIAEPVERFSLRMRLNGDAPSVIRSIRITEKGGANPVSGEEIRAGIRLESGDGPWTGVVALGDAVVAVVRTAGAAEGADLALVVRDETGRALQKVPFAVGLLPDGSKGARVEFPGDRPGWMRATVEAEGRGVAVHPADFAVVLPRDPAMERTAFLGVHVSGLNRPEHLDLLSELGFTQARVWELAWYQVQPEADQPVKVPDALIDGLRERGLEPLVVLAGTPDWASSAPEGKTARHYPPRDLALWEEYVRQSVRALGDRVRYYEIWNEPNNSHLVPDPASGLDAKATYAELLRRAHKVIREENPNALVVGGACAGHPGFSIQALRQHGLEKAFDVLSYHAYGGAEPAGRGTLAFAVPQDYLKGQLADMGRADAEIWDTESGSRSIRGGPEGYPTAMTTVAKGLVARQAAGFDRFYLYSAYPPDFSTQDNFAMVFGLRNEPLAAVPMFATWDRILGNARFVNILGDENDGIIAYHFSRADGEQVVVGWSNRAEPATPFAQQVLAEAVPVDAVGRRPGAAAGSGIVLSSDLRYFISPSLAEKIRVHGGEPLKEAEPRSGR